MAKYDGRMMKSIEEIADNANEYIEKGSTLKHFNEISSATIPYIQIPLTCNSITLKGNHSLFETRTIWFLTLALSAYILIGHA